MSNARWLLVGEVMRHRYRAMVRMDRDDLGMRINWPPRVGSGTAPPGPSRTIDLLLQKADIERAIAELEHEDPEAWMAVRTVDVRRKSLGAAQVELQLAIRTIHKILRERAWPFIAERMLRDEA